MQISLTQWLQIGIAVAGIAVQIVILRSLSRHKNRAEFSIFFVYNLVLVLFGATTVASYVLWRGQTTYFYIFWTLNVLVMWLEFGVLYEVLINVLKPYSALIDLGKSLFRWAALFLLLAGLLTALATSGPCAGKIVTAVNLMSRSFRLMQCGLLLLFFSFEKRLGLSWRSYGMSIALGLGIYAAVDLSLSYLQEARPALSGSLDVVGNSVYLLAAMFWAVCFAQREPERKNVLDSPSRLIFQRWNEALLSHSSGQPATASSVESFLPGIEKTVDRIMARSIH